MFSNIRKSPLGKIVLSILLLSVVLLTVGCECGAPTRGWSGPIVNNSVLYIGTIDGKVLGLDLSNVTGGEPDVVWEEEFETSKSGSLFACGAGLSSPMSTYGVPVIAQDRIYVGAYDDNIYSFLISQKGENDFDTGSAIVGSPMIADGTVFVGNSDGEFYALDLQLRPKWPRPFKTGDKIWATAEVDNGVVYIGSADHNLYALDIETGKEIWHFETEGAILSTPLVVDGTVYIGSCDNKFYAISAATEEERVAALARDEEMPAPSKDYKWVSAEAENWFWTKALLYEGKIWVGCLDQNVYVLNTENGHEIDRIATEGMVRTPPVLMNGVIIVGSGSETGKERGKLYRIDPQSGTPWDFFSCEAPILAPLQADPDRGLVYVHAQDGEHRVYAVDVETGDEVWSLKTS